jgi:hypothetical protein
MRALRVIQQKGCEEMRTGAAEPAGAHVNLSGV